VVKKSTEEFSAVQVDGSSSHDDGCAHHELVEARSPTDDYDESEVRKKKSRKRKRPQQGRVDDSRSHGKKIRVVTNELPTCSPSPATAEPRASIDDDDEKNAGDVYDVYCELEDLFNTDHCEELGNFFDTAPVVKKRRRNRGVGGDDGELVAGSSDNTALSGFPSCLAVGTVVEKLLDDEDDVSLEDMEQVLDSCSRSVAVDKGAEYRS
jgi:hypothetical protein